MKIAVHFPVYKREKLARISAACLARIASELAADGFTFTVVVIGSESWAKEMAAGHGWDYLTAANNQLGAKFDKGARYIVDKYGKLCTHYMEWGADNFVSTEFTTLLRSLKDRPGIHCITTNGFYMLREGSDEVRLFHMGSGSNIGRLTLMSVVRKIRNTADGHIYDPSAKRGLDRSFRLKVQAVTGRRVKLHDIATPYLADVKGRGSLNGWEQFAAKPDRFPLVELEGNFPELKQIRQTWQPPENSGQTPLTSTSTRSKASTRSTTQSATTRGKSSPAPRAGRSAANSKQSTRRRKTRTGRGKSS